MTVMSPSMAVVSFAHTPWLHYLISERRPNLLVSCAAGELEAVATRLREACPQPLYAVRLPGRLALPADWTGTALLYDVAQLTLGQQLELDDWMRVRPGVQLISVTTVPLMPLVEHGRFLEGLLGRMNVVNLCAKDW